MAKTSKNSLLCTFRACREGQTGNEYCNKHQPKIIGRTDLVNAIEELRIQSSWNKNQKKRTQIQKIADKLIEFVTYTE